ncbi:MAG: sigma-70 family RNA polymerase sigma factor [Acidobacteriota bacterium]|nr:sigma-70 family RNA polymerase sigma factor [Acidobacteriota bacterium]
MFEIKTNSDGRLMMVAGKAKTSAVQAVESGESGAAKSLEAALVALVKGGDREAFGRLYDLYAPMVHGILLARVPFDEVGDLVQDVFLVAFRKLATLRDEASFGGWLAMIARNRAMDFHRRARETEALSEELPQRATPRREAAEVLEVIRSLPEAYCETLVLRLVEGMTGPEIAERTGLQPDSVRVNLHRGMKLLREKLGIGKEI